MKKICILLGATLLALTACEKTETKTPQHLTLDLTINHMAPGTKSVKTGWADGDKVYVFFGKPEDHPTPAYLVLTRSGSSWVESWTTGLEAEIAGTASGTLTALYSPMDIEPITYEDSYKWYRLKENPCYALVCNNASYSVTAGVLSATLNMGKGTYDYVQFFLPGESANVDKLSFSCSEVRVSIAAFSIEDGLVGSANSSLGDEIRGFAFDGGVIFSGLLEHPGSAVDYVLTIKDDKGTSATSDDVTYTLSGNKTFNDWDAIALPALSEWTGDINGYAYVDLGNGLKWATMNVGATKPEEYGDHFAWGETSTKSDYKWSTYFDTSDGGSSFTKYAIDKKTVLDLEDDAARKNWGGSWRMPTDAEWEWLSDNCTWTWTADYNSTGVAGQIGTSKISGFESNSIFLPAAGCREGTSLINAGSNGGYWTSSLITSYSPNAGHVYFNSEGVYWNGTDRYSGYSVRPVSD